jgi:peptidoglycan hydrolase-like protein with peptidoglycan-binding domain
MRIMAAVFAILLFVQPAAAQNSSASPQAGTTAKPAGSAKARKPAPPPTTRDSSLPLAERMAIQFDLAWTGDYNGLVTGEINDRTTAAIKAFQRDRKLKETGVLDAQQRAMLADAAKAKQAQVGWSMVEDPVTGARIGLPAKQVPNKSQSQTGTRWSSAQGQIQVATFKIREPGTTLAAVYEQQKKEPPTRRLEVNLLRPDFFILSGMQNLKKFYVRAEIKDGEVRGMSVLYDQATEPIMDPVVVVMSSAFAPFPGAGGAAQLAPPPKRKVEYGTGIVVSAAGHIITDRQLTDGCNVVVVSGYGDADRLAEPESGELALLQVHGEGDIAPAPLTGDAAQGADLTAVGIADPQSQDGGGALSTLPIKLKGDVLEPAPQPGFSGAAALDPQGRIVGMVALRLPVMANAASAGAQQPQATMVPSGIIRTFLARQEVAPAPPVRTGLDAAKAAVVRVICVRK